MSIVAGAILGISTIMGVVSSQTAPPDSSPGNAELPTLEYGITSE